MVVTKSRLPGITPSQILDNLTYERINFPRNSHQSACYGPARAGPLVALRVCRAGSFFCSTRPAPASHMHFDISWELVCSLLVLTFLAIFSTGITRCDQQQFSHQMVPMLSLRLSFNTNNFHQTFSTQKTFCCLSGSSHPHHNL